ncbi:MAG TPA: hypothetical protein VLD63_03345, partial [Anaerolineales bacterium]|nr:hypothetical protein [Anaerolineales bacterium]
KSRLEGNLYDPFELAVRTHDVDFGQDVMVLHLGKDRGKLLRRFFGAARAGIEDPSRTEGEISS